MRITDIKIIRRNHATGIQRYNNVGRFLCDNVFHHYKTTEKEKKKLKQ